MTPAEIRNAVLEPFLCWHRRNGFTNCHCARFDDNSCVQAEVYHEFSRRRDSGSGTRAFADRNTYAIRALKEQEQEPKE